MKITVSFTLTLFLLLITALHSSAQSTDTLTLDYDPVAGEFVHLAQPRQTFPSNSMHAAMQATPDYPTTIRVRHHGQNSCRDLPAGQIDIIPFDEYVARVLPAEVPASWEPAALAAQAVAVRTYAWRQILTARADYDVSDWADFQTMCDGRHPNTDAAAAATAGQYLSAISDPTHSPIVAMYSAENGHPTLTNANVDYLQAVPDLPALGRERFGHGHGLSQWGAQRRALAGHSYSDILGHYYTNVYLSDARQSGEIAARLIGPIDGDLLRGSGLHWRSLLSTNPGDSLALSIARSSQTDRITLTTPAGTWQPIQPIQQSETITISLHYISPEKSRTTSQKAEMGQNFSGHVYSGTTTDQRSVRFDIVPPAAPTITATSIISAATLPITISTASTNTASTESISIGQQWIWSGDTFTQTADGWHSPPTTALPAAQSYRGLVTLRLANEISGTVTQSAIARLQISDLDFTQATGQTILGLRDLWHSDLLAQNSPTAQSTTISIDFHLFNPARGLTLHLAPADQVDFIIDSFQITHLPTEFSAGESTIDLPLHAANGPTAIFAASYDRAGNVSQIISQTVQINDITPPIIGPIAQPPWQTSLPITISVPLTDTLSGLDLQSGSLIITSTISDTVLGTDALAINFTQPENPWTVQRATSIISAINDGRYIMQFATADAAGNPAQSPLLPLRIDTVKPEMKMTLSAASNIKWHTAPISITLTATDTTSGIDAIAFTINGGSTQRYADPVIIDSAGRNLIKAWSSDVAGNQSHIVEAEIGIDLAAPTIQYSTAALGPSMIEVTWQAQDDASGVARITLQQRQENRWVAVPLSATDLSASAATIATNDAPELTIRMRASDNAGRSGIWETQTITMPKAWHYFPFMMSVPTK